MYITFSPRGLLTLLSCVLTSSEDDESLEPRNTTLGAMTPTVGCKSNRGRRLVAIIEIIT